MKLLYTFVKHKHNNPHHHFFNSPFLLPCISLHNNIITTHTNALFHNHPKKCFIFKRYHSTNTNTTNTNNINSDQFPDIYSLSLRPYVKSLFCVALKKAFPSLSESVIDSVSVSRNSNSRLKNDYQFNSSILLSRSLGVDVPTINEKIIESFPKTEIMKGPPSFVKSGHIVINVSDSYLEEIVNFIVSGDAIKNKPVCENVDVIAGKKVLIDYASPNISKELHVGHLRSIVLGESLSRIHHYLGAKVERVSHVGDFGTPIGLIIAYALEKDEPWTRKTGESNDTEIIPTVKMLSNLYTEAQKKKKDKQNAGDLEERAQKTVALLQQTIQFGLESVDENGKHVYHLWKVICEVSRKAFRELLDLLDVQVIERGESFYAPLLQNTVDDLKKMGVSTESQSANVVFIEGYQDPLVIQKSNGAFLYATTDLAAIRYRINQGNDVIIYITDNSQILHFQQVFTVAKKAGWYDPTKTQVEHVTFGVVKGLEGKKLSSRSGEAMSLKDLLDGAIDEATKTLIVARSVSRSEKTGVTNLDVAIAPLRALDNDEEKHDNSIIVGIGAVKYFDLLQRQNDYVFSYEQSLSFKGNTAVYILYAFTRICTLIKRVESMGVKLEHGKWKPSGDLKERPVAILLSQFPEIVIFSQSTFKPSVLCDYLYDLASAFHSFYEDVKIIGTPQQIERLALCLGVQKVIKKGLYLLGIKTTDKL